MLSKEYDEKIDFWVSKDFYKERIKQIREIEEECGVKGVPKKKLGEIFWEEQYEHLEELLDSRYKEYFIGIYLDSKMLVITAYGASPDGVTWFCKDGNKEYLVKDLVKEGDGEYGLIFLNVCNPKGCIVYTESSLLVLPDKKPVEGSLFSLYDPSIGEEIDDYTIDYWLKQ